MLKENTLFGIRDKVKISIDRLKAFEPSEGYYGAFSGGKDSQTIYHLSEEAGVKVDWHYNLTTIDPPELVRFIKSNYPDVEIHRPELSMLQLIEKKGLPTRFKRWCCTELKEKGGEGRICITGVRWAESVKRRGRKPFEIVTPKYQDKKLFNDNDEGRRLFENCMQKGKRVVNPIIDWEDEDVWSYLNSRNIEHCILYDQGQKRIGCIGCPLTTSKNMIKDFQRYPKYLENYKRAFDRFLPEYFKRCDKRGINPLFSTTDEFFKWWLYGTVKGKQLDGQTDIFDEED